VSKRSGKKSLRNGWPLLEAIAFEQIPLREVSGLAIAPLPRGLCLVAVGDHGPGVALAPLDSGRMSGWDVLDLAKLAKPAGAPEFDQAEAIAADGHQQALVLIEDPPLLLVLDTLNRRLTHAYVLVSGEHPGLDASWRDDSSSRGEGLVLLRRGHVLVLKEKRPAGLLEFGPPGDEPLGISADTLHHSGEPWQAPDLAQLVGLAWWPVDDTLADLSDAAIGPDGSLYLLSDQSNSIGQLALPLAVDGTPQYVQVWELDDAIEKAEGLTFLPDGSGLVAVDRSDRGRNLATLPPLAEWPRP